jgi:pre-mRNA-processing factor 39
MQEADTDNFENWEKLVRTCEALEGGLNRNSSPHALATLRDAYDRFLFKFPLLFGYWKKYADLEFNISGPESAEIVWITPLRFSCLPSTLLLANGAILGI